MSDQEALKRRVQSWGKMNKDIIGVLKIDPPSTPENNFPVLLILTKNREPYLKQTRWTNHFGQPLGVSREDQVDGVVLRAFYMDDLEIEFRFADPKWTDVDPVDPGTRQCLLNGAEILYDPKGSLEKLFKVVRSIEKGN